MRIESKKLGDTEVLRLHGLLSGADTETFEANVRKRIDDGARELVLDLSGLLFVDSRGLEALVNLAELQVRNGRTLKLAGVTPLLQEVLDITDLASLFEFCENPLDCELRIADCGLDDANPASVGNSQSALAEGRP
jgi:anti-anti-sigma factor